MAARKETHAQRRARELREAKAWMAKNSKSLSDTPSRLAPDEAISSGLLDHRDTDDGGTNGLTTED